MQVPLGKAFMNLLPTVVEKRYEGGKAVTCPLPFLTEHLWMADEQNAHGSQADGLLSSSHHGCQRQSADLTPTGMFVHNLLLSFPQSQQLEQSQIIICIYAYVSSI